MADKTIRFAAFGERLHGELRVWTDPDQDIVLHGAMRADAALLGDVLKTLGSIPYNYHGDLSMILAAARRMVARTERLLEQREARDLTASSESAGAVKKDGRKKK